MRWKRRLPERGSGAPCTHIELVERLNQVWNHRYEAELIRAYKSLKSLVQIRNHFIATFPHDEKHFSTLGIRSKICKIMRLAIRKFYVMLDAHAEEGRIPTIKRVN